LIRSVKKKHLMKFKTLKGIQDILPPEISIWHHIEGVSRDILKIHGFSEIRIPVIETTDIFTRSIGETTDIVEKEMYTFQDKGGRSVTLRPEGTASVVRAFVEHNLHQEPAPQKYYYMGPMFRYERPQAGRYRQFYQIGAEAMGTDDPEVDAEIISMLSMILSGAGLKNLSTEVTSIGCRKCRPPFKAALKDYLQDRLDRFCNDCQRRFETNPLRILDCKVPSCINEREGSPSGLDFLCEGCREHFDSLRRSLELLEVNYVINPSLVRGLDYYTKTAFEVTSSLLGSQNSVAAGGRYDSLVEEFGGPRNPGIGFAIGVERLIPLLKDSFTSTGGPELFICTLGQEASDKGLVIGRHLRYHGLRVEVSYEGSSLRSQMRKADRMKAAQVIVIGEDELKKSEATLKDMSSGTGKKVSLDPEALLVALGKT
jgi:histidyl-tRNA synthetase